MTQVTVTIHGRQFRMACEDGEEDHLLYLAKELDQRISGLTRRFGEIGDARLTTIAALMLTDELMDAGKKIKELEQEISALHKDRESAAERAQATEGALIAALGSAADRIEGAAKKLGETRPADNGTAQG